MIKDGFVVRLMRPDDIPGVISCIRSAYLETYPRKEVYQSEWFRRELKGRKYTFALTEVPDGRVAAHMALREEPAGFYELAQTCVDPRFRGKGLLKRMILYLVEGIPHGAAKGVFANAVTSHTITQKVNLEMGLSDVAIQLGSIPDSIFYIGMERERIRQRDSWVIQIRYLFEVREREVFMPERHRDMAGEIYDRLKIKRRIISEASGWEAASSDGDIISVKRVPDYGYASLRLHGYGEGLRERLAEEMERLEGEGCEALYADIDIGDENALALHEILEERGFFLSGLLPSFPDRDLLRMQRLFFPLDLEGIRLASASAERILDHVVKHMDDVQRGGRPSSSSGREV